MRLRTPTIGYTVIVKWSNRRKPNNRNGTTHLNLARRTGSAAIAMLARATAVSAPAAAETSAPKAVDSRTQAFLSGSQLILPISDSGPRSVTDASGGAGPPELKGRRRVQSRC